MLEGSKHLELCITLVKARSQKLLSQRLGKSQVAGSGGRAVKTGRLVSKRMI